MSRAHGSVSRRLDLNTFRVGCISFAEGARKALMVFDDFNAIQRNISIVCNLTIPSTVASVQLTPQP